MLPAIPTPIPMPFAQNGERRAIPETNTTPGSADASWATGFPPVTRINKQAGGKPPYGLDFQGLFHTICEHLFFSQSGNTVPWVGAGDGQPGLNYLKGAIVQASDGETYMALKPSGPDVPDSGGTGFVGPVDPVEDESGHWLNLNILYGGMPNSEEWITESGEWEAPMTRWYEVLLINGGAGGLCRTDIKYVESGQSGAFDVIYLFLEKGEKVAITIGSGGIGQMLSSAGWPQTIYGGITSFKGHTCRFTNSVLGAVSSQAPGSTNDAIGYGAGSGGGTVTPGTPGRFYGGGGGAMYRVNNGSVANNGAQGAVRVCWHDPAKAAGPVPTPALLSARRRAAPLAPAEPVTVNLYDPETGQGSVWREDDAEAAMEANGLISQEAWQEICDEKAAKDYAAWLVNPETEAERFAMLRRARDAKLVATDYLVAADYPLTEEERGAVIAYRQALRDLPAQEGAPWDGGGEATPWPEMPVVEKVQE